MESEYPVTFENNNDIPIAPPSIKEFGNKNPFNPKPAETTPSKIKNTSLIVCETSTSMLLTQTVIRGLLVVWVIFKKLRMESLLAANLVQRMTLLQRKMMGSCLNN